MSVSVILGHNSDGYLESSSTNYASALRGSTVLVAGSSSPLMYYGQSLGAGVRYVWQSFVRFAWTADPLSTPATAYLALQPGTTAGTRMPRDLEVRAYNWGTTLTSGNWRTPAQLAAAPLRGRIVGAHRVGNSRMRSGIDASTLPDSSGPVHYVLHSSRTRLQQAPVGLEWQTLRQAESSNTVSQRPSLYVGSVTKHRLDLSLGAQAQLSDGTHVYVAQTHTAPGPLTFQVWHHDGHASTFLGDMESVAARRGAQSMAVCVDDHDTVFVANDSGQNALLIRAWERTPSGWSGPTTARTLQLPLHDQRVNNVALAWHPQGGTRGTIMAVACREAGENTGVQSAYTLVNVDHVLTGTGSALRGSGNGTGTVIAAQAAPGFNNPTNETGSLLDVTAVRDASGQVSNRGYVLSAGQHQTLGSRNAQSTARYQLNTTGTAITTARTVHTVSGFSVKDPDAKARVLPVSRTQFVTVNASNSAGYGIVVKHHQQSSASSFEVLADVRLAAQQIASMPAPGQVATSSAWDAMYDPTSHLVWVYYFDAADPRRLLKTHVDLATGLAAADETLVAEDVGAAGSTNLAIRLHRGESTGRGVLVSVANRTSGGAHSLILVAEQVNLPPEEPRRSPRANFDATEDTVFSWEFRDPNPADWQSAYRLQIWDDATDTIVVDTDQTFSEEETHELAANTLLNGESFRWRVRTWDADGEISPWSPFGFFATSASGNVELTFPPVDNPEGVETADIQIAWQVTGTIADHYRVRVVRTSNEALHSDTGWRESTATTHLVQGLASEVEYRIEVTVRAAMVQSSTGSRLVTPDYSSPMEPVITVVPVDEGAHIRIEVDNPEPGVDLSGPDGSFEDGTTDGWAASPPVEIVATSSALSFGDSTTVTTPRELVDGDLLLMVAMSNYNDQFIPPSGWVQQQEHLFGATGDAPRHGIWLHSRIAHDEPSSRTLRWGDSQWHSVALIAVRHAVGFNSWAVVDADPSLEVDFPPAPVQAGDVVLYLGHTAQSGARTASPPVEVDVNLDRGVWVGHELATDSGDTPPRTFHMDGPEHAMAAAVLRLDQAVRLETTTDLAHGGQYAARMSVRGDPSRAGVRPEADRRVEVEEYHRYTVSFWAHSEQEVPGVVAAIDWYDDDHTLIGTTRSVPGQPPAGEWTLIDLSASAPAGAAWAGYGPDLDAPTAGTQVLVDHIELRSATDTPIPVANEVWRSDTDSGTRPVLVATVDPGDSYRDYLVGSGRDYTYTARAIAPDGVRAESSPASGQTYFLGVWIHDPGAVEETIDQYLHGKAQRSHSVDVAQALHQFVGRSRPVATHGEHQVDTWQITIDVPEGPDRIQVTDRLQAWAEARRTVVVRDNRGRVWISTLDSFAVSDQEWGDQVAFAATRVSSDLPGGVR
ncbi:glycoside hydrolase family 78 protein [Nocardiopsis terrae]|uniref:glycoside hydrolase family 78 protein n=1 Tax=Streptomyces sp. NPDC057554 TaxID=3350538 RepID=UPI0036BCEC31